MQVSKKIQIFIVKISLAEFMKLHRYQNLSWLTLLIKSASSDRVIDGWEAKMLLENV